MSWKLNPQVPKKKSVVRISSSALDEERGERGWPFHIALGAHTAHTLARRNGIIRRANRSM
jgi:hypothetical protein